MPLSPEKLTSVMSAATPVGTVEVLPLPIDKRNPSLPAIQNSGVAAPSMAAAAYTCFVSVSGSDLQDSPLFLVSWIAGPNAAITPSPDRLNATAKFGGSVKTRLPPDRSCQCFPLSDEETTVL